MGANYQVCRVQKVKSSAIGFVQRHNQREYGDKTPPHNVDPTRIKDNIELIHCDSFAKVIQAKVDEIQSHQKRKIRKDCPRALEYVISASKDALNSMSEREQLDYFKKSLEFFKKKHGADNVISAVIHFDEETPHMHIVTVPVKDNKLNAKPFTNRTALGKLQTEFNQSVGSKFALERGLSSEAVHQSTKGYNRSKIEKLEALREDLKDLEDKKKDFEQKMESVGADIETVDYSIPEPKTLESKRSYGERVAATIKERTTAYVASAENKRNQAKRTEFGARSLVRDKDALIAEQRAQLEEQQQTITKLQGNNRWLGQRLEEQNQRLAEIEPLAELVDEVAEYYQAPKSTVIERCVFAIKKIFSKVFEKTYDRSR